MAGTVGGFGIIVKINTVAITYLLEGEIPEQEKFIAEATPHNASGGYAVHVATGKRKLNEIKLTLGWDKTEATHAAVLTSFDAETAATFEVTTPGADEVITFSGLISKVGRIAEQEDAYKAEVTIQPTGAPTIA